VTGIPARPEEAAAAQEDILENMDFREKKLYHQIHPLKLVTDIGVTLKHRNNQQQRPKDE
jgi:hypothetical protein